MNISLKHKIRNEKLKKLAHETGSRISPGAFYNVIKSRYTRSYHSTHRLIYKGNLKHESCRKLRNYNKSVCYKSINSDYDLYISGKNCEYRKLYDYWHYLLD